jgi:uncharacterized protein (TIGR04551 family)
MILLLLALPLWAQEEEPLPAPVPPPSTPSVVERIELDGYFRTRGYVFHNLDLNHGPTPTTGEPIFPYSPSGSENFTGGNLRLRLDAAMHIVPEVSVHVRVDALDGLPLGSTPAGLPATRWVPSIYASTSQDPATSGVNSFGNSVAIKRAWGQAIAPFGMISVGRMGMPLWGVGMLANPGDGFDDDFDENVDRVGFATTAFNHFVGLSYDWNASGPTSASASGSLWGQDIDLEPRDNVSTVSLAVLRHLDEDGIARRNRADKLAFRYGAYLTWRRQAVDIPSYWLGGLEEQTGTIDADDVVERGFRVTAGDIFFDLRGKRWGLQSEVAHVRGKVANLSLVEGVSAAEVIMVQTGALVKGWVDVLDEKRLTVALEGGYASGDDASGIGVAPPLDQFTSQEGDLDGPQFSLPDDNTINNFRFHPNYHIDLILWRQIVGAVSDAIYFRPALRSRPHKRLDLELAFIHSRAVQASSLPGNDARLGSEIDLSAQWEIWHGLIGSAQYGLFLPGRGFVNLEHELEPEVAHALRLMLVFPF